MAEDFLTVLEKQKGLLTPETYHLVKDNLDKIPDEVKQRILTQLQNATAIKSLIDEYDQQRMMALKEAFYQFKEIEDSMDGHYKEAMQKAETKEQEAALESAEESLKQL